MSDAITAREQWIRYEYCRDTGHLDYLHKSYRCEEMFAGYPGLHWDPAVASRLRGERRPFITINKILPTLSSIVGEQIDLRTEVAFKGRYGAPSGTADTLTKLFKYISERNQLDWVRTEMFADGAITSRGYVDMRMNFDNSTTGDIKISNLNPRNVVLDPDAHEYDPDSWGDVIVTNWMSVDMIEVLYGKEPADELRGKASADSAAFGFDSVDRLDRMTDRFGGMAKVPYPDGEDEHVTRMVRVIDRQHRRLGRVKYVVDTRTGDRKMIPETWERDRIAQTIQGNPNLVVVEQSALKVHWTVTADDLVLHDKPSPYKHFTVLPYFPFLRKGRTVGLVENLIDPQELLNKAVSQELHVINTTANSGYYVQKGKLANMTADELESRGAQTGVVIEVNGPISDSIEKIQPNQIPQGLDQLSIKGENYIKTVSTRGDAQQGMARADASADQIQENRAAASTQMLWPLDNLKRSDWLLARNALDLVQEYITDPRALMITHNEMTGEQTEIKINWPENGEVLNDVTMGEYDAQVISQPAKQTLEANQFEQLAYMKEKLGIQIPDEFILQNSQAINKTGIIAALKELAQSAEAQQAQQMKVLAAQLELANLKADASKVEADATLKRAKAAGELANIQREAEGKPGEAEAAQQEMQLEAQKHTQDLQFQKEKHDQEMLLQREKMQLEMQIKSKLAQEDARIKRAQMIMTMRGKGPGQGQDKPTQGGGSPK